MEYPSVETLAILILLVVFIFCIGFGLGMVYREVYPLFQRRHATTEPGDEEIMIFDRVTEALSKLPQIEEPNALEAAQAEAMRSVGERYALRVEEVDAIYRRVWQRKHGTEG